MGNFNFCISTIPNEFGCIRYWDGDFSNGLESNLESQPKIENSFTSFLKLLIDQNGGYIQNLSEIYEEMMKNGFE